MKKAYLISTGTELLLGSTADSNSVFLSQKLGELGIKVIGKSVVGDNRETMRVAFETGLSMADLVIASGGLGPTMDDLTKEVACEIMHCELVLMGEELDKIKDFFARRNRPMSDCNKKQAMFPIEARALHNARGTAPGMYLEKNGKIIILLPGPPREMEYMYTREAEPLLKQADGFAGPQAITRVVKVLGPGESRVEEMLSGILHDSGHYAIALLARDGEVHIRMTAEGEDREESLRLMNELVARIETAMGPNIVAYDDDTLDAAVARLLLENKLTAAVAESCTGGLLASMITNLPGSSGYFWGGVVTYSNEAKEYLLGVRRETLDQYGAVSAETAQEMVQGILRTSGADAGIAITGIAGPDGGSDEKPVGLVYIATAFRDQISVKEMRFVGDRNGIRMLAGKSALDLLRRKLLGNWGEA